MYGPWGYPPPPFWGMPPTGPMPTPDKTAVKLAKQVLRRYKEEARKKKQDEKKKIDAKRSRMYSFMELTGAIFLFSIPVVMLQISLIQYCQSMMQQLLK